MLCVCFVVLACKGRAKDLFVAVASYASMLSFNNNSLSFNPSHSHILPSHHTHLTTLTLSRRQGRLPLIPCLIGQSRKPTQEPKGERRKDSTGAARVFAPGWETPLVPVSQPGAPIRD